MKRLPLSNGEYALVDDCDFAACFQYWPWTVSGGYPKATVDGRRRSLTYIYLHQFIGQRMGLDGRPDHKNRNKYDARRENLREATSRQNGMNVGLRSDNSSGFKGVSWYSHYQKWTARITVGNRYLNLGYFDSKVEAARAYNRAAAKYFGEFAYLNPV